MRTTLTMYNDVLAVARALAERNGISLGSGLSELARRGFKSASTAEDSRNDTVFAVAAHVEPITSEDVYRTLSEWS